MNKSFTYNQVSEGVYNCIIDLSQIYSTKNEIEKFNNRFNSFMPSDKNLLKLIKRTDNIIKYPHKSWIPFQTNERPPLLFLFGNPAPHSVLDDIYFSYEGKGIPHRFWKIMKEIGIIDIDTNPKTIKNDFFKQNYKSSYFIGMDVIFTFPTPSSEKKWSGVQGIYKLFGKKATEKLINHEKLRINNIIKNLNNRNLKIVAMQKDAFEAISNIKYDIKKAVNGELHVRNNNIDIWGTPPTRWLYTQKMKSLLYNIKKIDQNPAQVI